MADIPFKNKIELHKAIKVSRFKKDIRTTIPHKHQNYFEIIYISQGNGSHFIDLVKFPVVPPMMFFVRQEQVHYWALENEPDGYVIIIKKAFVDNCLDKELKSLIIRLSKQSCISFEDNKMVEQLLNMLTDEYKEIPNDKLVIEGLLKSLLAKVIQVAISVEKSNTQAGLYYLFIDLLMEDLGVKNKVSFYARKLHTSPQNLNAACKKAVNQSASNVLNNFVTNEIKRLLLYTDNTISQIALTLDFSDSSHLIKFFKKVTGTTPQFFRMSSGL